MGGFPGSLAGKESACSVGDRSLIPGSESSPGKGIGYPLQYSCASLVAQLGKTTCHVGDLGSIPGLERSPGEGKLPTPVFWPGEFHGLYIVHGVMKSRTRLSDFHFH